LGGRDRALAFGQGLVDDEWPEANKPAQEGWIAYHVRTGMQDVTDFDWQGYLDFADKRLR